MSEYDPRPQVTTGHLVTDAVDQMRELLKSEVALARSDIRREVLAARAAAITLGVAGAAALLALSLLLVALALAIDLSAVPALVIGIVLLVVSGVAGYAGYRALPRKPLDKTRDRIETDVNVMKEQVTA